MTPFNGQQFVTGFTITMDCRTEGATIRWSQGTGIVPPDPTESGPGAITYTGPFQWNASPNTYFFKVKAFKNGLAASQTIQTGGLTISAPAGTVTTPTITPNGGTFANPVQVTLATTTQSALIAYTDDGTDPSTVLPILPPTRNYNGNLTLSSSKTIKAKGYRPFFLESGLAAADFVFQCGKPVFAASSGDYVDSVVVSLTSETTGGNTKIRYALDGSDPTESSTEYGGPFALGIGNHSVRARVFRLNFQPSTVASAEYSVAAVAVGAADHTRAAKSIRCRRINGLLRGHGHRNTGAELSMAPKWSEPPWRKPGGFDTGERPDGRRGRVHCGGVQQRGVRHKQSRNPHRYSDNGCPGGQQSAHADGVRS